MSEIHVIFTHHTEFGACNSDELLKIIESINPDVIFEEMTSSMHKTIYMTEHKYLEPLEIVAVKRYKSKFGIEHIPVDIDIDHSLSTEEINYMFNELSKYNAYRKYDIEIAKLANLQGFSYLNSENCRQLFVRKREAAEVLIPYMINKNYLINIHKLFYDEQDRRENVMIKNINEYYSTNKFNRAIFFIGSGHGASIAKKIKEINSKKDDAIVWKLFDDQMV